MSNRNNRGNHQNTNKNDGEKPQKKIESPEVAVERLTKEILHECRLIATGCTESCYDLVEKTKQLMKNEELIGEPVETPGDGDDSDGDDE